MPDVDVAANLAAAQRRVAEAASRAGRSPDEVTVVAVSKTIGLSRIHAAYQAGQRVFGENRVQEAEEKVRGWAAAWPGERPSWHLVGHLQTNKAKLAASLFDLVHSVDSVHLAEALDRHGRSAGRVVSCLLEVHLSAELTKSGFAPEALPEAVERVASLSGIRVEGLMTIAPLEAAGEAARPYFRRLRGLRDELAARFPGLTWRHLSMGMTNDFEVAVEEGATLVRIGRAIFGERG
jgi:pyridoxal phosphate enzyme (YggS family)